MIESVALGLAVLLLLVPVGVGAWWYLLRLMDKAAWIDFRVTIDRIEHEPLAAAVYFGLRAIAAAYLIGQIVSRFV